MAEYKRTRDRCLASVERRNFKQNFKERSASSSAEMFHNRGIFKDPLRRFTLYSTLMSLQSPLRKAVRRLISFPRERGVLTLGFLSFVGITECKDITPEVHFLGDVRSNHCNPIPACRPPRLDTSRTNQQGNATYIKATFTSKCITSSTFPSFGLDVLPIDSFCDSVSVLLSFPLDSVSAGISVSFFSEELVFVLSLCVRQPCRNMENERRSDDGTPQPHTVFFAPCSNVQMHRFIVSSTVTSFGMCFLENMTKHGRPVKGRIRMKTQWGMTLDTPSLSVLCQNVFPDSPATRATVTSRVLSCVGKSYLTPQNLLS